LQLIDEITGIFDHTPICEAIKEMPGSPHIPLHPDLRNFALHLIQDDSLSPAQLCKRCHEWAKEKWGTDYPAGDDSHRFMLSSHKTTSLYRTIAARIGILQQSAAEANLDQWF